MPSVAAAHVRRGDRVQVSARGYRTVLASTLNADGSESYVRVSAPVAYNLHFLAGVRRYPFDDNIVRCRPDLLLSTVLGSAHPTIEPVQT